MIDDSVRDILLVCVGSSSSLLGSVIAIVLGYRNDRIVGRRERAMAEFIDLRNFLFDNSRVLAACIHYLERLTFTNPQLAEAHWKSIEGVISRIQSSHYNGIPRGLITANEDLQEKLAGIYDTIIHINMLVDRIRHQVAVRPEEIKDYEKRNELFNQSIFSFLSDYEKTIP